MSSRRASFYVKYLTILLTVLIALAKMDSCAAQDHSNDVARMLGSRREVGRLLGHRAAPELSTLPTPA